MSMYDEFKSNLINVMETMDVKIKLKAAQIPHIFKQLMSMAQHQFIVQTDYFFYTAAGYLKTQVKFESINEQTHPSYSLIFYYRPYYSEPKRCSYVHMPINESSSLLVSYILKMSNGLKGNILKKRDIFKLSYDGMDAQISFDKINHLGNFMQIEILLDENQDLNKASNVINSLMDLLCLTADDLIAEEYIDLLETYKYNIKVSTNENNNTKIDELKQRLSQIEIMMTKLNNKECT